MANERGHYGTSWIGQTKDQRNALPDETSWGMTHPETALFRWPWLFGAVLVGAVVLNVLKPGKTSKDFWETRQKNWERHHPGLKYPGHGAGGF